MSKAIILPEEKHKICKAFGSGNNPSGVPGSPPYHSGMRYCSICAVWIPKEQEGVRCPCCNGRLRFKSKSRYRSEYISKSY